MLPNRLTPVLAAHALWHADYQAGKNSIDADTRFRASGERIVRMLLLPGLFENPYLDLRPRRSSPAPTRSRTASTPSSTRWSC
ncbi:MAG: hypothetical protein QM619_12310 [Micropruina sp.]|uniref:hypothetical protein n=1 Tax=Micropruina sp. TaxID=2737536 RepID=UPI0039E47B23